MLQCYLAISEQLLQQNKKVELEASGVYLGMHEGGGRPHLCVIHVELYRQLCSLLIKQVGVIVADDAVVEATLISTIK